VERGLAYRLRRNLGEVIVQPFEHILVATDFGDPALHATLLATALARTYDAKLTLLHVYTLPTYAYGDGLYWPIDDLGREAKQALDSAAAKVRETYPKAEGVLTTGSPWEQILAVTKARNVDLVVVGTHGRRGITRALLGSVAEKIVRMSPVPVLTVGPRSAECEEKGKL
jgi:nucleotide-binding universal stress UspA family protein